MNKYIIFSLITFGIFAVSSCTQEEYELVEESSSLNSIMETAGIRSLQANSTILWKPDSATIQKARLAKKARSMSSDAYFSDNLNAIAGLHVYIDDPSGNKLFYNYTENEIKMQPSGSDLSNAKYIIKTMPAISGMSNIIYPTYTGESAALAVGQYISNPDEKVLIVSSEAVNVGFGISWTISRANGNKKRVVITSDDFFGEAWNRLPDGKISFSPYINENQEFIITTVGSFNLYEINYVDTYYAQISTGTDYIITNSYTNNSNAEVSYIMPFQDQVQENSSFIEEKGINFSINGLEKKFRRPHIVNGEVSETVNEDAPLDASYVPSENLQSTLSAYLPLNVPAKTKVEIQYRFKTYYVSNLPYEATITYSSAASPDYRDTKLHGYWSGTLHVDEMLEPTITITNLRTNKIKTIQPDIKKTNKLNPLKLAL